MNAQPPPLLKLPPDTGLPPPKPANLGGLGMRLSCVAPAVFVLFLVLRPG